MTRDQLIRLLLRLAIVFVGLQIAAVVLVFAAFACLVLGDDVPLSFAELPR